MLEGEKGENKTGAKISLYTEFIKWDFWRTKIEVYKWVAASLINASDLCTLSFAPWRHFTVPQWLYNYRLLMRSTQYHVDYAWYWLIKAQGLHGIGLLCHIGHIFFTFSLISYNSDRKVCDKVMKLYNTLLHTIVTFIQINNSVSKHLKNPDIFVPLITWENRLENVLVFQVCRDKTIV